MKKQKRSGSMSAQLGAARADAATGRRIGKVLLRIYTYRGSLTPTEGRAVDQFKAWLDHK